MNLGGDLRYVTEEDYASFGGREKRKEAWDVRTGWLGKQIYDNFNITHVQNGHTAFSHGDMEPEWARLGVDTLNFLSRDAIWKSNFRNAPIFQGTGKCATVTRSFMCRLRIVSRGETTIVVFELGN